MRDKNSLLGLAVVALVAAVIGLWLCARKHQSRDGRHGTARRQGTHSTDPKKPIDPKSRRRVCRRISAGGSTHRACGQDRARQHQGGRSDPQAEEMTEERIKVIEAWENFIDTLSEKTRAPTAEEAIAFKREFAKLDKRDQMDGIQTALHLLPEEQFPILYPILFDKTIDPDILDEIFSDGLNHDEDIKVPMMKEIYKDKEHPMYVEAARILDATGELDEEGGDAEKE